MGGYSDEAEERRTERETTCALASDDMRPLDVDEVGNDSEADNEATHSFQAAKQSERKSIASAPMNTIAL